MTTGITIQNHPGALTDSELAELLRIAVISRRLSPDYATLLRDWIEQEYLRREETDEPIEPELPAVNCSAWSDLQLANAIQMGVINLKLTDNSSPRVRELLYRIVNTIAAWNVSRMGQANKD